MATKQVTKEPTFLEAVQQFCQDKSLSKEAVMAVISDSLSSAYIKKLGLDPEQDHSEVVQVGFEKGDTVIKIKKKVVEKENPTTLEISLEEAKTIDSSAKKGDSIWIEEKTNDLSRIVSTHAKQAVFQKLKDMERDLLYREFKAKEGELTHGYFQRWKKDIMSIDLGKIEGVMLKKDQNPGEKYRIGDRLKAIIYRVELRPKEPIPFITLSRANGDFVKKLFEMEIPEIYDGIVEILNVARIPSIRTKVVVHTDKIDVDPVGACVGMKGVRIQSIVRELGNERIDIVQYSPDPTVFISHAISPAKPIEVHVNQARKDALVVVSDDSLSLAIGMNGSNVKLASQLSGYRIDIKTVSQYNQELASPEAREKLDRLFSQEEAPVEEQEVEEEEFTPLTEIPGLTPRVISLLESGGIHHVERLIEISPEDLAKISGVGAKTADHILRLLKDSVEWVEEGEE
jgi:N utilization substance protein A